MSGARQLDILIITANNVSAPFLNIKRSRDLSEVNGLLQGLVIF